MTEEMTTRQMARISSILVEAEPTKDGAQGVIANSDLLDELLTVGEAGLKRVDRGAFRNLINNTSGLVFNDDGSIGLRAKIDYDETIEGLLITEAEAVDWQVDKAIDMDIRIQLSRGSQKIGVEFVTLMISRVASVGTALDTKVVVSILGRTVTKFGLAELLKFVPYREGLRKAGVRHIVALGTRFRDSQGEEWVVGLNINHRKVDLYPSKGTWGDNAWFGRSRKA